MTRHLRPRSTASLGLIVAGLLPVAAEAALPPASDPIVETVSDDLPAQIDEMIAWALDLFDEAGMELPPLRIVHHGDDTTPCNGGDGMHRPGEPRNVVELCTNDATFATQAMVLHELAHAWVDHNVGPERRAEFQALRGYTHWHDYEAAAWHENGTEQAAEIVAWGLFDRPMSMVRINGNSCAELEAGYRTLTGEAPLHGFHDLCRS